MEQRKWANTGRAPKGKKRAPNSSITKNRQKKERKVRTTRRASKKKNETSLSKQQKKSGTSCRKGTTTKERLIQSLPRHAKGQHDNTREQLRAKSHLKKKGKRNHESRTGPLSTSEKSTKIRNKQIRLNSQGRIEENFTRTSCQTYVKGVKGPPFHRRNILVLISKVTRSPHQYGRKTSSKFWYFPRRPELPSRMEQEKQKGENILQLQSSKR